MDTAAVAGLVAQVGPTGAAKAATGVAIMGPEQASWTPGTLVTTASRGDATPEEGTTVGRPTKAVVPVAPEVLQGARQ